MAKKHKKTPTKQPAQMRWEFDSDIPTCDFFEEGSLDEMGNLQEAVDSFVHWLEEDRFLMWEAVVSEEQGIPLSPKQKKALGRFTCFSRTGVSSTCSKLGISFMKTGADGMRNTGFWFFVCRYAAGGSRKLGSMTFLIQLSVESLS